MDTKHKRLMFRIGKILAVVILLMLILAKCSDMAEKSRIETERQAALMQTEKYDIMCRPG